MAKPNAKAPLGQGGRFAAVEVSAAASGARNPAAVAAAAGRKKYGASKMAQLAAAGRRSKHGSGVLAAHGKNVIERPDHHTYRSPDTGGR